MRKEGHGNYQKDCLGAVERKPVLGCYGGPGNDEFSPAAIKGVNEFIIPGVHGGKLLLIVSIANPHGLRQLAIEVFDNEEDKRQTGQHHPAGRRMLIEDKVETAQDGKDGRDVVV